MHLDYIIEMLYAVCVTVGVIMSYWNRPLFSDGCRDDILADSKTYDTIVRIAGPLTGIALSSKAIADHYGWTHIVVLTDDDPRHLCFYARKDFEEVFGRENYTLTFLLCGSEPTDKELDDLLKQIRSRARGLSIAFILRVLHFYSATKTS